MAAVILEPKERPQDSNLHSGWSAQGFTSNGPLKRHGLSLDMLLSHSSEYKWLDKSNPDLSAAQLISVMIW